MIELTTPGAREAAKLGITETEMLKRNRANLDASNDVGEIRKHFLLAGFKDLEAAKLHMLQELKKLDD